MVRHAHGPASAWLVEIAAPACTFSPFKHFAIRRQNAGRRVLLVASSRFVLSNLGWLGGNELFSNPYRRNIRATGGVKFMLGIADAVVVEEGNPGDRAEKWPKQTKRITEPWEWPTWMPSVREEARR